MKKILFMTIMFLTVCISSQAAVKTGEPAPDFKLYNTASEGSQGVSLSDYRGKYVVLEWLNHDCPFVKKHYNSGNMQSLQKSLTAQGIVWLSINSSAHGKQGHYHPEEANQLTEKKGAAPTSVLMDFEGAVGRLYGARTTPHMFIIDPNGVLIYQGAIDNVPSADPADIGKAVNYVQLAINEAMAGKAVSNPSTKSYGCSVKY